MEEDPPGPEQDSSSSSNAAERAAGLVAAALRLTPPVLLPGDTAEVPSNMLRVKLGASCVRVPYVLIVLPRINERAEESTDDDRLSPSGRQQATAS